MAELRDVVEKVDLLVAEEGEGEDAEIMRDHDEKWEAIIRGMTVAQLRAEV
ncbi:hypothetical protein T492DRAFT_863927 [Pavlovales sp. CCMP2436]|nr:hypothetical protein T492DRAFT_863927 [Pavlovales sp. CCMP2436]